MSSLLLPPLYQATDQNGIVLNGAKLLVYIAGTTTLVTTYTDPALTSAHANPVVSTANGRFPNIYVTPGQNYKIVLQTSTDVEVETVDNIPPTIVNGSAVLPITSGGTGASTAANARTALSAASQADLTAATDTLSVIDTAQATADWELGTSIAEGKVSPAKVAAAIAARFRSGQPSARIWDQKASGLNGGDFTTGDWRTRDINQEYDPDNVVSTLSNEFTFTKAGWVMWSAPAASCGAHRTRLFNVTDAAPITPAGTTELTNSGSSSQTRSWGAARVEAAKAYRIEHRCAVTRVSTGFGNATNFGEDEVYSELYYWADL